MKRFPLCIISFFFTDDDYRFNTTSDDFVAFSLSQSTSFVVGVLAIDDTVFEYLVETLTAVLSIDSTDIMYIADTNPQQIIIIDTDSKY